MKIVLDNIKKHFGDKVIFDGFSHVFEEGTVTAVCGESGCGKTTLLRIITGLDKDYSGKVTPSKFSCSAAFQEPRLFPGATVSENLLCVTDKESAEKISDEMKLERDVMTKYPDELSGGMARRISLARALLYKADITVIDEPFAGLDEDTAHVCAQVIKKYTRGKTCIVVTHNRELAAVFADNFLELENKHSKLSE